MSEAKALIEVEIKSGELKTKLTAFWGLAPEQRREQMKDLLVWIEKNATKDVISLLIDRSFQQKLETATDRVINTPIDSVNKDGRNETPNKLIVPIQEGFTVAALDETGSVLGLVHKSVKAYDGFNVCGVALEKAVVLKVLQDEGITGGLRPEANFRYAQRLGYTRHTGSADSPHMVEDFGDVYLGASGCGQNPEMAIRLLDGDGAKPGPYTLAGTFDNYMAEVTGNELSHPSDGPIMPINEPEVFSAHTRIN